MYQGVREDFKNAWSKPNNAVVQIILINIIVFVFIRIFNVLLDIVGNGSSFDFFFQFLQLPASIHSFIIKPWTLVTYFFVHYDLFHILFNMLFLYWFGRIIQDYLNSSRVISLYVLGGLAGGLLYILTYNLVPYYAELIDSSVMIGASAGVFAVVVGAAVFMPNYTVFLLFLGPVRIKYIAMFYVFLSFIQITGSNAGGEIAHLGGALIGWVFIVQLKKGNDLGEPIMSVITFFKSLFKPQSKIRVTHKSRPKKETHNTDSSSAARKKSNQPSQDEIDIILDKISQSGYESLSEDEKQKLFNVK